MEKINFDRITYLAFYIPYLVLIKSNEKKIVEFGGFEVVRKKGTFSKFIVHNLDIKFNKTKNVIT